MVLTRKVKQACGDFTIGSTRGFQAVENCAGVWHIDGLVEFFHFIVDYFPPFFEGFFLRGHYGIVRAVNMTDFHNALLGHVAVEFAYQVENGHLLVSQFRDVFIDLVHLHQKVAGQDARQYRQHPHAQRNFTGQLHLLTPFAFVNCRCGSSCFFSDRRVSGSAGNGGGNRKL